MRYTNIYTCLHTITFVLITYPSVYTPSHLFWSHTLLPTHHHICFGHIPFCLHTVTFVLVTYPSVYTLSHLFWSHTLLPTHHHICFGHIPFCLHTVTFVLVTYPSAAVSTRLSGTTLSLESADTFQFERNLSCCLQISRTKVICRKNVIFRICQVIYCHR